MNNVLEKLKNNQGLTIAVLGDLMLDEYIWGRAERISPESPVPIVVVESETTSLGGAGNVIANARGLGAKVIPVGLIGKDFAGETLLKKLQEIECDDEFILLSPNVRTITKTRILAQNQHVVRVDREDVDAMHDQCKKVSLFAEDAINRSDVVILSDYGKGSFNNNYANKIIKYANRKGVPILIDPKGKSFEHYRNCSCIKPNIIEASREIPFLLDSDDAVEKAAILLKNKYNFGNVIITRGAEGMSVLANGEISHVPTNAKEVYNVSGAGDTVIATLAICLGVGLDYRTSARVGNIAAGIVVERIGPSIVELDILRSRIDQQRLIK